MDYFTPTGMTDDILNMVETPMSCLKFRQELLGNIMKKNL